VILDDAHIEGAVNAANFGAFMNSGQICMSTERIIVDDAIADGFVDALVTKAGTMVAGAPEGKVHLGSVVDAAGIAHVAELIDDATSKGATLRVGGVPDDGTIMKATVLDGVTKDMRI